jgi:hypothetical protein
MFTRDELEAAYEKQTEERVKPARERRARELL